MLNMDSKRILRKVSQADMRFIIEGYLPSDYYDTAAYIKVYELYVLEDMSTANIARQFKVTRNAILQKINRLVFLVLREPILIDQVPHDTDLLSIPVEKLFMSARTYNCIKAANMHTVGDMLKYRENRLLRFRNLGRKTLNEIKTVLQSYGISYHTL